MSGGVSERKWFDAALYESESMFRILAEMSSAVIYVYQGENLVYVNEATERITGYSKDELLKKKFWEIFHPDLQGLVRQRGFARQHGEPVPSRYEIKFLTKGGETRWAELTARRIELNGKPAGIATFFDITERKNAEEALRQANLVVENSPVVLFRWKASEDWPVTLVSRNVGQFGYRPEEFLSGVVSYASVIYAGDLERVSAEVEEYSASGTDQFRQEYRIITRDGRVRWVDDRTVIERDAAGKITHYQGIIIDITERKRVEEALRESEERLRLCIATARLGSYDSDLVNDRHIWSPETYDIYGVPQGTPLTLEYIHGLVVPEDLQDELFASEMDPATSHGGYLMEYRIRRPSDGTIRWVYARTRIFFSGEGVERKAVRILGIVQDITEPKQAEEALRESERRNAALLDAMPDLMFVLSPEGDYLDYMAHDADLLAFSPERIVGKNIMDTSFSKEMVSLILRYIKKTIETRELQRFEYDLSVPAGLRSFEARLIALNDREVLGIVRDVTEQKAAGICLENVRSDLERSLKFTEALLSAIPIPVFYKDGEGRYMGCNRAFSDLMGVTSDQIKGKTVGELWPAEHASVYHDKDRELMEGQRIQVYEYKVRDKDGIVRPVIYAKNVFRDENDQVVGIVGTFIDIFERKQAEKALKEAKQRAELYLDLMGHDINNMHQIALGYLELALETCDDAGQKEFLEKPMEVLRRSALLIDNVRKLQKLKDGMLLIRDVDLCRVLMEVQREFGSVPNKAVKLSIDGLEHCSVKANELLYDVFANLVSNAIKHTGDHACIGIGMDVVEDNGNCYYRVMVEDDGSGIPDNVKDKILNRILESSSREKGSGFGLYLVKSLVDSYHGRVWVEDRIKGDYTRGARFVVLLPKCRALCVDPPDST